MTIDKALEELEKYAEELVAMGDANQAIANNKENFLDKIDKLNLYYNYIIKNVEISSPEWIEAIEILGDMTEDNPSLEEWESKILETRQENTQKQPQDDKSIDPTALANIINSYTTEIKNLQNWDPEHIEDIEWQLEVCKETLKDNKDYFEPNVYNALIEEISISLNKIDRFYKMINSEAMENIVGRGM